MTRRRGSAALWLAALGWLGSAALALAEDAPANNAPLSPEAVSLQGFGAQNAACLEWSDGCAVCLRDDKGARCSTPGIACQPVAIACRRETPK